MDVLIAIFNVGSISVVVSLIAGFALTAGFITLSKKPGKIFWPTFCLGIGLVCAAYFIGFRL